MSHGPGYACVACQTYLRPRKNEIYVLIENDDVAHAVWCADLWECPDCGTQVILGYGQQPVSKNYKDDFEYYVEKCTHSIVGPMKGLS